MSNVKPATRPAWATGDAWVEVISASKFTALMYEHALTNRTLALLSGYSEAYISHLRTGRRRTLSPQAAHRIAVAMGVPFRELFFVRANDAPRIA